MAGSGRQEKGQGGTGRIASGGSLRWESGAEGLSPASGANLGCELVGPL